MGRDNEGFWSWDRKDLALMLDALVIETIIVGKKGTMARMMIANPRVFVLYNSLVAEQTSIPEEVRHHVSYQVCLAKNLIENYLPNYT